MSITHVFNKTNYPRKFQSIYEECQLFEKPGERALVYLVKKPHLWAAASAHV